MRNNDQSGLQDLEWAIGLNRASLRLMGAWPNDNGKHEKKLYDTLVMPIMILAMFCFVFLPQMYALPLVSDDLALVIDNILSSSPALIGCSKFFILWLNKEMLRPVVDSMKEDWLQHNKKHEFQHKVMKKSAFIGKSFTNAGYLLLTVTFIGFMVAPLFGLDMRLVTNLTDYGKYPLAFQSYYPYDYSRNLIFELTLLSQFLGGWITALSMAVPDHYFGVLVYHLSGQFEVLGMRFENLFQSNVDRYTFIKRLGACVDRHGHLMKMVTIVEDAFTFIIMYQVLSLYIYAGCTGIRIVFAVTDQTTETSFIQIITFITGFVFITMFTFANCLASENLTYSTLQLSEKIYNSLWYLFPNLPCRDLIIVMSMSRQPSILTAGKLMELSLSNYCSILKSIGGYISVFMAILDKN